jgi:hypothetical protein
VGCGSESGDGKLMNPTKQTRSERPINQFIKSVN